MTSDARELVDRLMALWAEPVPPDEAGVAAFGACYAAELMVNGTPFTLAQLVDRARTLQRAYRPIRPEVLQVVAGEGQVAVAFLMHVRHVGPLPTPLGELPATGLEAAIRTIDILTVRDGLVTGVTVVADELGLLTQLGRVRLT